MKIEPIINARFRRFRESYDLADIDDGMAFERFVNHTVLSAHQPDAFGADAQLLDSVCVGGRDDMGIDGIGIKLNGLFVAEKDDVDDIIDKFKRASVEFIFIQSKYKSKFDMGDFNKFTSGIRDFLSETHYQPRNEKVNTLLETKDHLLSDDVVVLWESNPTVRLYYVAMGKWRDSNHILALSEKMKDDIRDLGTYGDCQIHFVDAEALKTICDNNENTFSTAIEAIDTMPLTASEGVDNSCIALCYANELLTIMTTNEGVIRKSLFDDNVRDFQGLNSVNVEIDKTVVHEPEKFGLLNNGITIVCDEFVQANRRITIKNPQIVNGCQTCHVLFDASARGVDVKNVLVHVKLIATGDLEIINQIVRGTNRQNIVLNEAFETTKKFHKDLEEFFDVMAEQYGRIYYERRSKQFQHNPQIKQTDTVNLSILTKFIVGMFLNRPHLSHRHEAWLLKEFQDRLYQDQQSKLPYFTAALTFVKTERLFRHEGFDKKRFYAFRAHLSMLFRELVAGAPPSLNSEKQIDEHCRKLLEILTDDDLTRTYFEQSQTLFERARDKWTNELQRSPYGIKDTQGFTNLLQTECRGEEVDPNEKSLDDDKLFGEVTTVIVDRNGRYAAFIRKSGQDLFFHSKENSALSFESLKGKIVSYRIGTNPRNGRSIAVDVDRVE